MEIAIISSRYPTPNNIYSHMWVHARAKEFVRNNVNVTVFVPSKENKEYHYEGVKVVLAPDVVIAEAIKSVSAVYIHLLSIYPYPKLSGWPIYKSIINNNVRCFMYLHGSEVQSTARYSFDDKRNLYSFAVSLYKNNIFLPRMRKFCQYVDGSGGFLSPSKWMHKEAENELSLELKNVKICPNGIDTELFDFKPNHKSIHKMLCVRPLSSNKYAVDEAIKLLPLLPEKYTLDIYGKGELKNVLLKLASDLGVSSRVTIIESFIDRVELPKLMGKYGTFLATTRMDAQGVIMCEAMAAGMLVITSNNTAIPEFVNDMVTGLCHNDLNVIAENLLELEMSENTFNDVTINARKFMQSISMQNITKKELAILGF